ncbi:MAG: hypothetical protein ACYDH6_11090 [Acidimicrobiales bacterium]
MKAVARVLAVGVILSAVVTGAGVPAHGDIPATLQVYEALSGASPIEIISKVPAETDGGLVFAQSHIEIGKAIAVAAGATLGPLGNAFVITSAPVPGFTSIPTVESAQYPPSRFAPAVADSPTNVAGPGFAVTTFHAAAPDAGTASSDATGGSGALAGVVRVGGATSHSDSKVTAEGSVITRATSSLSNVTIGPAGSAVLSIATMTSTATVTVPLAAAPTSAVTVKMGGVLLAGVPVDITQTGINIAGALPVPATGVATVNAALAQLSKLGVTIQAVPTTSQAAVGTATVGGGAIEIGYQAPASLFASLPSDVGTNETIILGEVSASATGRPRTALNLPPASAPPLDTGTGASPSMVAAPESPSITPSVVQTPLAFPAPASAASLFALPKRTRNAATAKWLLGYRMFVIAALATAIAYVLSRSTRHAL